MKTKTLLILILLLASFFRLWKLNSVPVSLFGDEIDVGYHAYSILKTGKDYSGNSWPLHFKSLAEWRTPLYLYSAVPTVAAFGVTPLGVRLPAATFGILGVLSFYLLLKEVLDEKFGLIGATVLASNPWHLQYSRAGFEVTLLLFLLLIGLYFFFKSFRNSKFIILSSVCLALTPWVYSTAKLFTPILLAFLFIVWRKEILSFSKKYLVSALLTLLIIGGPIAFSTIFGGGAQRFGYISVFSDPTTETEVGVARQNDARVRGEMGTGLAPTLLDRVIHNKFAFWGKNIIDNYFQPFSGAFLFTKGDINPRHSIGVGEFHKIEAVALILGLVFFFSGKVEKRIKFLIVFWVLVGVVPSAITREGGMHATRLIIILPPLVLLISYGIKKLSEFSKLALFAFLSVWILGFGFYLHSYYVHYPWESERWWHAGWNESIKAVKEVEKNYDKVVISMAGEPAWIFFAGHYMYSPDAWHKNFPVGNDVELPGFGKVSHIDKFYFSPAPGGLYEWGGVIDEKTLYLANAAEARVNLVLEPERLPANLKLVKAVTFPSGEPAFYLLTGNEE